MPCRSLVLCSLDLCVPGKERLGGPPVSRRGRRILGVCFLENGMLAHYLMAVTRWLVACCCPRDI